MSNPQQSTLSASNGAPAGNTDYDENGFPKKCASPNCTSWPNTFTRSGTDPIQGHCQLHAPEIIPVSQK